MPTKPEKSKLRRSIFAFHKLREPEMGRSIRFANLIRGTSQWKKISRAIDYLEKRGQITENDSIKAKQILFEQWQRRLTRAAQFLDYRVILNPPADPQSRKTLSRLLSSEFMPNLIPNDAYVIGCITANRKKRIEIFLDRDSGVVRIVEADLKPRGK